MSFCSHCFPSFFLSLSLFFLFFCRSFQSATIAAFLFFLYFLLWSCYLGLCLPTSAPRHSSVITCVAVAHLPALVSSVVCCAVFRKLKWRQRVFGCVCGGRELSAMWGLPCRTCILIFIEQIEQPNEILIVCHACGFCGLSPDVRQFITVCAV